ncbi:MAG: hypothetical protein ACYC26_13595 [Phycisphaerales bacterium]
MMKKLESSIRIALLLGCCWTYVSAGERAAAASPDQTSMRVCGAVAMVAFAAMAEDGPGHEYDGVPIQDSGRTSNGALPVIIRIDPNQVIRPASPELLGLNHNWMQSERLVMDSQAGDQLIISKDYLQTTLGLPMPLNRMSGTESQNFSWKWTIGPLSERKEQKNVGWDVLSKKRLGPVEWIQSVQRIDPNAKFVWCFNMTTDTVEDAADLVEFLTGDPANDRNGGFNWAQRRVELGLKNPVPVAIWELGNELDWSKGAITIEEYIERCRAVIAAVRAVNPNAKFSAHAATGVWAKDALGEREKRGGWRYWHQMVLKKFGDQIDYIVFHPYYSGLPTSAMEEYMDQITQDIREITGSNRIKLFLSEHARWPERPPADSGKQWKDVWYQTHSLEGCLATAQFLNRLYSRVDVAAANYHCFSGGPWGLVYLDKATGKDYTTGMFDLIKLFYWGLGDQVVAAQVTGEHTVANAKDLSFTATAMTTRQGLNIILVNRDPDAARPCRFTIDGAYRLVEQRILTAPNLDAFNTAAGKPITVTATLRPNQSALTEYTVPAHSMVVLKLEADNGNG